MAVQKLSIRLLKEGKTPQDEDVLTGGKADDSKLMPPDAELYTEAFHGVTPPWAKWLGVDASISGKRACLFVPAAGRWFALCFAYGHTLLNSDACADDFGLILGLNMLAPNALKSTDMFSPSDNSKQKRVQTTTNSDLTEHEFNGWTNILKSAAGKVKQEYREITKNIQFSCTAVSLTKQIAPKDLPDFLAELFRIYKLEDFKKTFPEATRIKAVKDSKTIEALNENLFTALQDKNDDIYCIIPDLVDFSEIAKYSYNFRRRRSKNTQFYESVSMQDIYEQAEAEKFNFRRETPKSKKLFLYDEDGKEKQYYPLLRCFVWDCDYNGKSYHYSHGQWYCVDADFMKQVDSEVEARKASASCPLPFHVPTYSDEAEDNEASYNQRLAMENGAILLDQNCVPMGGHDKIEPCDVLYKKDSGGKHYFIHVKHKHGGSSGMAHLFAQGDNSLELLINKNTDFIKGLKDLKDKNSGNRLLSDEEIKTMLESEFTVVYLIIAEKDKKTPRLPLFSKIALSRTLNSLKSKRQTQAIWDFVRHTA